MGDCPQLKMKENLVSSDTGHEKELEEMKILVRSSSSNRTYDNDMTQTYIYKLSMNLFYLLVDFSWLLSVATKFCINFLHSSLDRLTSPALINSFRFSLGFHESVMSFSKFSWKSTKSTIISYKTFN